MSLTAPPPYVTTGELGDTLGVQAWRIVRLFELGILFEPQRIGGRRLIPKSMIPAIVDALRARGWLAQQADLQEAAPVKPCPRAPAPGSVPSDVSVSEAVR
jgi:hypothetical protein